MESVPGVLRAELQAHASILPGRPRSSRAVPASAPDRRPPGARRDWPRAGLEPQSDNPRVCRWSSVDSSSSASCAPVRRYELRGDRRRDQSALVRAQVSASIARSGKANLGTEAPGQVKVEPAKQTATRCPTRPIVIAFDADLRRTVDGRKAVALLGSQQPRPQHPVACSADLEIGGKTAISVSSTGSRKPATRPVRPPRAGQRHI